MLAAFSFVMSLKSSSQVAGGAVMPAWVKSALLYQKPTTPRLYGTPYCLPLYCQPATAPPRDEIHGLTYLVMSPTLPAFTWVASAPPPHCWKMSGGLLDWSASGILVFCSCSFWIGTGFTVTVGWSLWKSFATFCQ